MHERQMQREANEQAVIRIRMAHGAIPSRMFYARQMLSEAIALIEGTATAEDFTRYHEAKK